MKDAASIQKYFDHWQTQIEGWFYPGDMLSFVFLCQIQEESGFGGNLCEVGVYHGKSLALLGLMRRSGERLFAFDLFEFRSVDELTRTMEEVCGADHGAELIQADSLTCTRESLSGRLGGGVRFLHIDAGHEHHEVLSDLRNFAPFLEPTGVIAMDDYYDRDFPGVCAAIHEYLRAPGTELVPFLSGPNKLYLCHRALAGHYLRRLLSKQPFQTGLRLQRMYEHPVLVAFAGKLHADAAEIGATLERWLAPPRS